jgi:hypothetical protein
MASPLNTPAYEVPNWLQYGNGTGAAGPEGSGKVGLYANQGKYTLVDNKTGNVLAEGSSPEELKAISDIISGTLVPQGNDADWRLYSTNPVVQTRPHRDFLGGGEGPLKLDGNPFGDVIQGYNDLSTPGDPRGVVIAGDQPNNFFKDMLLPLLAVPAATAGAYFGGNALLGAMGGKGGAGAALGATGGKGGAGAALGATGGKGALSTIPGAIGSAGEIVVTALPAASSVGLTTGQIAALAGGLGGTAAAGLGSGASSTGAGAGGSATSASPLDAIQVIGKPGVTALDKVVLPAINTAVTVPSVNVPSVNAPTGPGTGGGPNDIIEVVGKPVKPYVPPITIPPVFTNIPPVNAPQVPTDLGKSLSDKLIDYSRLGAYGADLVGSLFGGGGGGSGLFTGTGNRDPIFSAKLPAPSLPGGVSSMSARQMPEQNWYEYGFNPEQSFFNTSAPGYTPEPGKTPGMARGGDFAVRGPGDGRSDSIPARLSDGEYVIDAETVALLGNGSPKAGAERLDDFRVSIRKHKGRNLAQGKFSVNAKKPEAYLAGGRA